MATRTLAYDSRTELEKGLPRDLRRFYGNGVVVDDIQETQEGLYARLGLEVPEVLSDAEHDEHVISFLHLRNVGRLRFSGRQVLTSSPIDRSALFRGAEGRRRELIQRAETAMVAAAKGELVMVHPIGSGLNPIRELLVYVNEEDRLDMKLIRKGKQLRYLPLLEGLGYLRREYNTIHPGPELQKFTHASAADSKTPEFYNMLLGEILALGYREIREALSVQHLVPIVRTANAYYWSCQRIGHALEFRARDFLTQLRRLHPRYRVDPLKLRNHLVDIAGAGIMEKNGSVYTAKPDVMSRYATATAGLA